MNHVLNVRSTLAQVIIVDLRVDREQPVADNLRGPFSIRVFLDDVVFNVARQFCILEKQQVRVKDVSMTAAELFFRAILDGFELSTRKPDRGAKNNKPVE